MIAVINKFYLYMEIHVVSSNRIFQKKYLLITLVIMVAIVTVWFKSLTSMDEIKEKIYEQQSLGMEKAYSEAVRIESDTVLGNADNISRDSGIIHGLKTNDRMLVLNSLKSIKQGYRSKVLFGSVKIHVHDRNIHSFVRLWSPDKFGDDLSGFRKSIVAVKEKKAPLVALEVGVTGVELRGIVPVFSANEYVGSIEFMQGMDTIVRALKQKFDINLIVALDNRYIDTAKELKHATRISSNLTLATNKKTVDQIFLEDLKAMYLNPNIRVFNTQHYYTRALPIKDFSGNVVAYAFLGKRLDVLEEKIKESKESVMQKLVLNSLLGIVSLILLVILFSTVISQIRSLVSKKAG